MLLTGILRAMVVCLAVVAVIASDTARAEGEAIVRVGALHSATPTGRRHLDGIRKAKENHKIGERIELISMPYVTERGGEEMLLQAIAEGEVHLVLGPTDSGVFIRAWQQEREPDLRDKIVPVISSLVVATEANDPEGWFFRTNVDVNRRAGAIYDYLAKRWVNSIAVLYADTEFGRRSEDEFRKQLRGAQRDNYMALPYVPPYMRSQLQEVLALRPEAVGVFGEREEIGVFLQNLRSMNAWATPYRPLLFTVIDIRQLGTDADGFLFVSAISPREPAKANEPPLSKDEAERKAAELRARHLQEDDVFGLSYDTTTLVLNEIAETLQSNGQGYDKTLFRNRLAKALQGAAEAEGELTGMQFSKMTNIAPPQIYEMIDGLPLPRSSGDVGFKEKWSLKFMMLANRFGLWPFAVGFVMLLTVFGTATHDIYRWYGGGFSKLILRDHPLFRVTISWYFLALVALQGLVALGLFCFLAETGRMRYDSVLNGFIIALAPSPLLRTSFATIGGMNFGVADQYDQLLQSLTRNLLRARYTDRNRNILVIAYYNSLGFLERILQRVYASLPNKTEANRLRRELKDKLASTSEPRIAKRKFMAKKLVELRTWEDLYELECVPKIFEHDIPFDPEKLVFRCVNYCQRKAGTKRRLKNLIRSRIEESGDLVKRHYQTKVKEAKEGTAGSLEERDALFVDVQFLVLEFRFREEDFLENNLIPDDESEQGNGGKAHPDGKPEAADGGSKETGSKGGSKRAARGRQPQPQPPGDGALNNSVKAVEYPGGNRCPVKRGWWRWMCRITSPIAATIAKMSSCPTKTGAATSNCFLCIRAPAE